MARALALRIDPHGHLKADEVEPSNEAAAPAALLRAFEQGLGEGLLHLAGPMLDAEMSPPLAFAREIGRTYYEALCRASQPVDHPLPEPSWDRLLLRVPPMRGAEYANAGTFAHAWGALDRAAAAAVEEHPDGVQGWLEGQNSAWHGVGRVYFHLAENKRDSEYPFAFVATYVDGLDAEGRPLHRTLGHALDIFRDDRDALLRLLRPLEIASGTSSIAARLVESGEVYQAVRWTPEDAFAFLQEVPACEAAGVLVRVPDWWRSRRQVRVTATVGSDQPSELGFSSMLDFRVELALGGESLSAKEQRALLNGAAGLRLVRGQWVAVDPDRLEEALSHFAEIERAAKAGELSFAEGMRLLSGLASQDTAEDSETHVESTRVWSDVVAGSWLRDVVHRLTRPTDADVDVPGLEAELRPYQRKGLAWAHLLCHLGLGGCLADDMGLGKTLQILALMLRLRADDFPRPHLVAMPASLLGNWQAEAERFAPSLDVLVAHRSHTGSRSVNSLSEDVDRVDVVLTTYGTLSRTPWLREYAWGLVVLDEAQAIKNPGTKQTRVTKTLRGKARMLLTGTPVENRIDDLWSLMDFACPGLLDTHRTFRTTVRQLERKGEGFGPVRRLLAPYILRRLKTDPSILPDLPDKTEVVAWCGLSKRQAALYQDSVESLRREIEQVEGMKRRGLVLAYLQRFKQICNHPSHWLGDADWSIADSGKFSRLVELCEPLAERQERVLVFTQFRQLTRALHDCLATAFGRPGLRMDGRTPVRRRAELVERFQEDDGPPFFVISVKAGGTGLNLTAASHVVHFDRWWNPAVENQATDRAFRIGQKRNVLVQKFACRGTLEERIDAMIAKKQSLADEVLSVDASTSLTEMTTDELMATIQLDMRKAVHGG